MSSYANRCASADESGGLQQSLLRRPVERVDRPMTDLSIQHLLEILDESRKEDEGR